MMSLKNYKTVLILVSFLSACSVRKSRSVRIDKPELPKVQFVAPKDPKAIICLDDTNAKQMLERDIVITQYIKKLEYSVEQCQ